MNFKVRLQNHNEYDETPSEKEYITDNNIVDSEIESICYTLAEKYKDLLEWNHSISVEVSIKVKESDIYILTAILDYNKKQFTKFKIMKKYTIIYSDYFQIGSHRHSIVRLAYIECEKENLVETIESKNIDMTAVNYILNGHCEQSED